MLSLIAGVGVAQEFVTIDVPGATFIELRDINKRGEIVVRSLDASFQSSSYVYSHGTATIISVPGALFSEARGINDRGDIVGYQRGPDLTSSGTPKQHAFVLRKGVFTSFDVSGCTNPEAFDINNEGEIVGRCSVGPFVGFFRDARGISFLVDAPQAFDTTISGVNDAGRFVGTGNRPPTAELVYFVGDRDGALETSVDVHGKPAAVDAFTNAQSVSFQKINNKGAIAGTLVAQDGSRHGFVIGRKGRVRLIDVPGAEATRVTGINRQGDLVGTYDVDGVTHGFLMIKKGGQGTPHQ